MIAFILSSHIDEWYNRYDSNSTPNQIRFRDTFMSHDKRSLLIINECFYSRSKSLSVDQKSWFNYSIDEFKKLPVRNLKQCIANTKNLFILNKTNNNYGKQITSRK